MPLNCSKPILSPAAGLAELLYKITSGADVLLASVDSITKLFATEELKICRLPLGLVVPIPTLPALNILRLLLFRPLHWPKEATPLDALI